MLKGESLTFVNGDSPRQSERILAEYTLHLRLDNLCRRVDNVSRILPFLLFNLDVFVVARAPDGYPVVAD